MANYIVSDTNLTAVANAIRQKGGTSASLEFPDDFVSAIGDIQTGGGSSVTVEALNVTQNGTYTAPFLTNLPYADTFRGCTKLEFADLGLCTYLANNTFYGDTKFKTLILRSSTVATLNNTNAFNSSPFASGMSGGTVYVPEALISNYQSASNWSTIFGRPNNQILKLEGSIYE